jgi:hypothetical protein
VHDALARFTRVIQRAEALAATLDLTHDEHAVVVDACRHLRDALQHSSTGSSEPGNALAVLAEAMQVPPYSYQRLQQAIEDVLDPGAPTPNEQDRRLISAANLLAMAALIELSSLGTYGARRLRDSTTAGELNAIRQLRPLFRDTDSHPAQALAPGDEAPPDTAPFRGALEWREGAALAEDDQELVQTTWPASEELDPGQRPSQPVGPPQRQANTPGIKIFISHSSGDRMPVERLASELSAAGHQVWLDAWEINVDDAIVKRIRHGMQGAQYVVLCYSRGVEESPWMKQEWLAFLARLVRRGIRVLPVLLSGGRPPPIPTNTPYADLGEDWDAGMAELLRALHNPSTP